VDLKIGTRGSKLALWQSGYVKTRLLDSYPDLNIQTVIIKTTGDKFLDTPLSQIGAKGLFVKELETALLSGQIDLIVHSMKDLPTQLPEGLIISTVMKREEPGDVFLSNGPSFHDLAPGAKVGTSSLRRRSQLMALRPDLEYRDLRGNVDTRLRKLSGGEYDGIVLACAGIRRLGLEAKAQYTFPVDEVIPAVAQGALAIEIRKNDENLMRKLSFLDHKETRTAVSVERDFLAGVGGGCQVPVAAHCTVDKSILDLSVFIGDLKGEKTIKEKFRASKDEWETLGKKAAQAVLKKGGQAILEEVMKLNTQGPLKGKTIAVTQAVTQNSRQIDLIRQLGGTANAFPMISIKPLMNDRLFKQQVADPAKYEFIIFSSMNSVRLFNELCKKAGIPRDCFQSATFCAVGSTTADSLRARGFKVDVVPASFSQEGLVKALPADLTGKNILIPRAKRVRGLLKEVLEKRGAQVTLLVLYETVPAAGTQEALGPCDFITFTSPSCVNNFFRSHALPANTQTVCIGQVTAEALKKLEQPCHIVAEESTIEGMIRAVVRKLNEN
jgi:hydroxymethylbilane synthase